MASSGWWASCLPTVSCVSMMTTSAWCTWRLHMAVPSTLKADVVSSGRFVARSPMGAKITLTANAVLSGWSGQLVFTVSNDTTTVLRATNISCARNGVMGVWTTLWARKARLRCSVVNIAVARSTLTCRGTWSVSICRMAVCTLLLLMAPIRTKNSASASRARFGVWKRSSMSAWTRPWLRELWREAVVADRARRPSWDSETNGDSFVEGWCA